MNLHYAFNKILNEYAVERTKPLTKNPLADFVRNAIPNILQHIIDDPRYIIKGSVGEGLWARSPWIAVFDKLVTDSVQDGYYPVYILSEDYSGIYLTLNQGVTSFKEKYLSNTKYALKAKAADYLAQLGKVDESFIKGPINLNATNKNSLPALYEAAAIVSKYYPKNNIPNDFQLTTDLFHVIKLYNALVENDDSFQSTQNVYFEDPKLIRLHKRIDRNTKLSKEVKKIHGTKCKACSIDMKNIYGDIGDGFIESHHLKPIATLKEKVQMDPKTDFTVLCPNCHAMIHRSPYVSDIEMFKKIIKKRN